MIPRTNKIKNSFCKKLQKTQSERTAKMSDPKLSGAFSNNVNSSFNSKREGRVTAVVAKGRYKKATENQA